MSCRTTEIPNCLWGSCLNGSICVCSEGFVHDMFLMRFTNCGMPLQSFYGYGGFALALCIVGACANLYVIKSTLKGSLLRQLSISAIAANGFFCVFLADVLAFRTMTPESLVFFILAICTTCFAFSFLFLSVLLPVSKISRTIAAKFIPWRRFWLYFIPLFTGGGMTISYIGAFAFTAPDDDEGFNNWLIGQAVIFMILTAVAVPAFTKFTGMLISGLESALDLGNRMDEDEERTSTRTNLPKRQSTNDTNFGAASNQNQEMVKMLLEKVVFIRRSVICAGLILFAMATLTFASKLAYNTVPLFWAIVISGPVGISLFTIEMAWYTRKKRESEKRRSTMIPFLADIGRHISMGLQMANNKRLSSSRGSNAGGDLENCRRDQSGGAMVPHQLKEQALDLPSTVKEEPSQLGGTWVDGMNSPNLQVSPGKSLMVVEKLEEVPEPHSVQNQNGE